jgi:hypothetical protein
MLSRSRLYTRKEPGKDARLFIIFCEGERTEPNYFKYFNGIASQIRIELIGHADGQNSPLGLYGTAEKLLLPSKENPTPKYDLQDDDEIWFIIDTDSWGNVIGELKTRTGQHKNWFVAQSNPCFEVWQYYHIENSKPTFAEINVSKAWKKYLSDTIGGFNAGKHPIFLQTAIQNARQNHSEQAGTPAIACTQVFQLGEKILPLVKAELDAALALLP